MAGQERVEPLWPFAFFQGICEEMQSKPEELDQVLVRGQQLLQLVSGKWGAGPRPWWRLQGVHSRQLDSPGVAGWRSPSCRGGGGLWASSWEGVTILS